VYTGSDYGEDARRRLKQHIRLLVGHAGLCICLAYRIIAMLAWAIERDHGATYAGMPPQFAYPAAFGDLLAALLAMAAILAVVRNVRGGRLLVWIFNLEGTVDLIAAMALATIYGAPAYMGPAYWIPALWVPALLVTHYITACGGPLSLGVSQPGRHGNGKAHMALFNSDPLSRDLAGHRCPADQGLSRNAVRLAFPACW
jgi:hypothetical protein